MRLPVSWYQFPQQVGVCQTTDTMANMLLRIPDDLHTAIRIAAAVKGTTLRGWLLDAARVTLARQARQKGGEAIAAAIRDLDLDTRD
jgi:plasmid stability protein